MYFKKYLKKELWTLNLQRKAMGKSFCLPFIINYLFIPFIVVISFQKYGTEGQILYSTILLYSQYFTPVFSAWWIIFVFMEPIEGDGNELLFMDNKVKLDDFFRLLFLYILSIVPPFIVYTSFYSSMVFEYIRIIIECVLFASLAYFLIFLFRSITAAMISIILYCFFSIFGVKGVQLRLLFFDERSIDWQIFSAKYFPIFVASIVFIILGALCNYKFNKYN